MMKSTTIERAIPTAMATAVSFWLMILLPSCGMFHPGGQQAAGRCSQTAQAEYLACQLGANERYWNTIANCENIPDTAASESCRSDARSVTDDDIAECRSQYETRTDVCAAIGEDPYDPPIDPENFVESVTNPYFPLIPGTTFVYQGGDEEVTVVVTHQTKEILGVRCVVVQDTASVSGEVIEDTEDWFAQDRDGNVWYFGELSRQFENGVLASLAGSWEAGRDGAKPGIIMKANPQVGETYRQEFSVGVAEDLAEVLSLTGSETTPGATCSGNCLVTEDFSPFEPGVAENKYYQPGVGLILEIGVGTGERVALMSVTTE